AELAPDADVAPVGARHVARQGQPESETALIVRVDPPVATVELLEHPRNLLRVDSDAAVGDLERDPRPIPVGAHPDLLDAVAVPYGIAEQIEQHLRERVGVDPEGRERP